MPLYISIRFLTGRAHLHHWHAHHSDGKVDWPPSPWRLLRALVAAAGTGLTSLPEPLDERISDAADDPLPVSRLADVLAMLAASPKIWLPRTGGGHTRQFLPKSSNPLVPLSSIRSRR
jgi:CRISPR-associated protein Csb2